MFVLVTRRSKQSRVLFKVYDSTFLFSSPKKKKRTIEDKILRL